MYEELQKELEKTASFLPKRYFEILVGFLEEYLKAVASKKEPCSILKQFLTQLHNLHQIPFTFPIYHAKIRAPFDYYTFGLNFIRPLIDEKHSLFLGKEHLDWIQEKLEAKENIVFFSNHQTEADPQIISLLLEKTHPKLALKMIYVAGERVITDPLSVPFSMGCDLLCIYSRRYIDHPKEKKGEKQHHNKAAMRQMSELLKEGGKLIYVAPSGGRDRKSLQGKIEVAPFDPDSIEMFFLIAERAKRPTHFLPMALYTYEVLPPPDQIQQELGEDRLVRYAKVGLSIQRPSSIQLPPEIDRRQKRILRAESFWKDVNQMHEILLRKGTQNESS